jgi:hypothetical protein
VNSGKLLSLLSRRSAALIDGLPPRVEDESEIHLSITFRQLSNNRGDESLASLLLRSNSGSDITNADYFRRTW